MRRLISKALLRRSPRRLDGSLPVSQYHDALTPVAEEEADPEGNSVVASLFSENPDNSMKIRTIP
jgi:hypothetical protein